MRLKLNVFVTARSSNHILLFAFFKSACCFALNFPAFVLAVIFPMTVLTLLANLLLQNVFTVEQLSSRIHSRTSLLFSFTPLLLNTSFLKFKRAFISTSLCDGVVFISLGVNCYSRRTLIGCSIAAS